LSLLAYFDLEFGFLSQKTVRKPQPRSLDPGTEVEKTVGFLAEKIVMFGEDKMACHQRAFLFTNTRLFYVTATG
jgi:hypothetical protein